MQQAFSDKYLKEYVLSFCDPADLSCYERTNEQNYYFDASINACWKKLMLQRIRRHLLKNKCDVEAVLPVYLQTKFNINLLNTTRIRWNVLFWLDVSTTSNNQIISKSIPFFDTSICPIWFDKHFSYSLRNPSLYQRFVFRLVDVLQDEPRNSLLVTIQSVCNEPLFKNKIKITSLHQNTKAEWILDINIKTVLSP